MCKFQGEMGILKHDNPKSVTGIKLKVDRYFAYLSLHL